MFLLWGLCKKGETMQVNEQEKVDSAREPDTRLHRWQVFFASGSDWYAVGEFVALDETSAIERAVEVLGSASAHRAEEIPWDAAPLSRQRPQ
jgi:hypothetical protein